MRGISETGGMGDLSDASVRMEQLKYPLQLSPRLVVTQRHTEYVTDHPRRPKIGYAQLFGQLSQRNFWLSFQECTKTSRPGIHPGRYRHVPEGHPQHFLIDLFSFAGR